MLVDGDQTGCLSKSASKGEANQVKFVPPPRWFQTSITTVSPGISSER